MIIGYARVSTQTQSLDRQIDQLTEYGCERIYSEKASGKKNDRPFLDDMLDYLREGDTVVVSELSRLSRSTKDLFVLLEFLQEKNCNLVSLKEAWIDTSTPQGRMMYTLIAGISQFERDLISQRTKEGLFAAKARGRPGGRPVVDQKMAALAVNMYENNTCCISEIVKATGISKGSLYKYVRLERKKRIEEMQRIEKEKNIQPIMDISGESDR